MLQICLIDTNCTSTSETEDTNGTSGDSFINKVSTIVMLDATGTQSTTTHLIAGVITSTAAMTIVLFGVLAAIVLAILIKTRCELLHL